MKRLEELGRRYGVPPAGLEALAAILALQAEDPTAPTTVREVSEAVDRHVADSLVALDLPAVRHARRIADLGAGAGWPGLALAAALPDARVALVESAIRHCRYLERAVAAGRLANVEVVHARAEEWAEGSGRTTSSPPARWPRCRCCASTPRRCWPTAGCWWPGRARCRRRGGGGRPRPLSASSPSRWSSCSRIRRPSGGRCTSSARSRPRRSASPRAGMAVKRPLA